MTNQTQPIVYTDDLTIMANETATPKVIKRLDKENRKLGLKMNESKIKYIVQPEKGIHRHTHH